MHVSEQFYFDFQNELARFERELLDRWEANQQASAKIWTLERFASVWYLGWDSPELWRDVPIWIRERVVSLYQIEQDRAEHLGLHRIRAYREVGGEPCQEQLDQKREMAERMAQQLSADWAVNRPPSVYTYDPVIACMVSMRLGRKIVAVEEAEVDARGFIIPGERKEKKSI